MISVLSFFSGDKPQAIRLAQWIRDLGGVKAHDCLLAVYKDTDSAGVIEPLREAFGRVGEIAIVDDMVADRSRYQYCANIHWKRTAQHIAEMNEPAPWAWVEVDAVPLCPEWMDSLAAGYKAGGKPFMLDLIHTRSGGTHNSGIGVYPAKVRDYTVRLWELENDPWDVFFAQDFMPHTYHGPLIHDAVATSPDPTFLDAASLSFLRPGSVLYHRDKSGCLIDRLRERKRGDASCAQDKQLQPVTLSDVTARSVSARNVAPTSHPEARRIYTYCEDLGPKFTDPELLALSQNSFRRHGFSVVVLSEEDARTHPLFGLLNTNPNLYRKDKGITPYQRACYNRWMAVALVSKNDPLPPVMVDFDLINYGFTPDMLPPAQDIITMLGEIPCPGMMIGTNAAFERMIAAFAEYAASPVAMDDGLVNDQRIIDLRHDLWTGFRLQFASGEKLLVEYLSEGWQTAKLVHYPFRWMPLFGPDNLRSAEIKRIRPPLGAPKPEVIDPEKAELLARIARLEVALAEALPPKRPFIPPPQSSKKIKNLSRRRANKLANKDTRTPEQIQDAKDRMAKARAGRKLVAK